MTDEQRQEEWETEDVEVSKAVAPVISVRFAPELADRLFAEAERRGVRTSTVVREAVESFLDEATAKPATLDVTISSALAPITLYTGRSRQGRTLGADSQLEPAASS